MSSLAVPTSKLKKLVQLANLVSLKSKNLDLTPPKFTSTRLEIQKTLLILSATDGKTHFQTSLDITLQDAEVDSKVLYIPTDAFYNILNLTEQEDLELEIQKNLLTFKSQKSVNKINLSDIPDDYEFPKPQDAQYDLYIQFKLKARDFINACKAAFISVGNPNTCFEPEFLNIVFETRIAEQKTIIVSTDKHRLVKNTLEMEILEFNQENIDLNNFFHFFPKPLQFVVSCLSEGQNTDLTITMYRYFAYFDFGNFHLCLPYGNDNKFPPYERIIPQSFACSFEVSRENFLKAARQVAWCITDHMNNPVMVELEPDKNGLTLSTQNENGNSAICRLEISNYEGTREIWKQKFNLHYLESYLKTIDSENFLWEVNHNTPSVLSPANLKDRQLYLVSGLR